MTRQDYARIIETHDKTIAKHAVENIAKHAAQMIYELDMDGLPPPRIRTRIDITTGKVREIGCECAMQQVLDIIAVNGAMDIFKRRIVPQQASSIPGRGQVYGVRMIQKWVSKDNAAIEYAKRHKMKYSSEVKYFVKTDIRKCYPSMRLEVFMKYFEKDCGNAYLLWLWRSLLESHRVDEEHQGFMIGALVSQWAAQYLIRLRLRTLCSLKSKADGAREIRKRYRTCVFLWTIC